MFVSQFITLGLAAAFLVSVVSPRFVDRVRQSFASRANATAARRWLPRPRRQPSVRRITSVAAPENTHDDHDHRVSYSTAVSRAAPAVVNIYANKVVSTRQVLVPSNPVFQRMFPVSCLGRSSSASRVWVPA